MPEKKGVRKKRNHHPIFKAKLTLGQRSADIVTKMCGSWGFIIGVLTFMAIWMVINIYMIINKWDPYPFILLNFVLSCLAAMQAPIILMSQNRQTERDRMKLNYDYNINKKSLEKIEKIYNKLENMQIIRKRK